MSTAVVFAPNAIKRPASNVLVLEPFLVYRNKRGLKTPFADIVRAKKKTQ